MRSPFLMPDEAGSNRRGFYELGCVEVVDWHLLWLFFWASQSSLFRPKILSGVHR